MDSSPSKRSDEGEMEKEKGCGKLKLHQAVELCVLTGITLLVWGGLTLPTVFYFVTKPTVSEYDSLMHTFMLVCFIHDLNLNGD